MANSLLVEYVKSIWRSLGSRVIIEATGTLRASSSSEHSTLSRECTMLQWVILKIRLTPPKRRQWGNAARPGNSTEWKKGTITKYTTQHTRQQSIPAMNGFTPPVFSLVHFLACHRIFFRCLPSEFAKRTFRDKRFVQCLEVVARIETSHFLLGANGTQRFIIQVRPRGWQEAWISWFFSEGLTYHIEKNMKSMTEVLRLSLLILTTYMVHVTRGHSILLRPKGSGHG